MNQLLANLDQYDPNADYVMAIITETQGSTYRKAGAMMLINQSGKSWGLLSGGCLEGDIIAHTEQVFANEEDKRITYDMRGDPDLIWGLGLGCDGAVHILLKFLPKACDSDGKSFIEVLNDVDDGIPFFLTLSLTDNQMLFLYEEDQLLSELEQPGVLVVALNPTYRILICGASPDVPPVVNMAAQLGWQVTVIDHRPDYIKPERFSQARMVIRIKRSELAEFVVWKFNAAVVMSHQYERDLQYLDHLLNSDIPYIGLLGPQKRRDKLLKDCDTTIEAQLHRVFGPVGLKLGGHSPESIALGIVGEIQAVLSGCLDSLQLPDKDVKAQVKM
ncbi:MAG: XdhC family protein [Algicola sp.]|nr:XdhC family protein [Algicola sp.]